MYHLLEEKLQSLPLRTGCAQKVIPTLSPHWTLNITWRILLTDLLIIELLNICYCPHLNSRKIKLLGMKGILDVLLSVSFLCIKALLFIRRE